MDVQVYSLDGRNLEALLTEQEFRIALAQGLVRMTRGLKVRITPAGVSQMAENMRGQSE